RETLLTIRKAVESVGHFEPVTRFKQLDSFSQSPLTPQVFRNPSWQLELYFDAVKDGEDQMVLSNRSKLTNVRSDELPADVFNKETKRGLRLRLQQPLYRVGGIAVGTRTIDLVFNGGEKLGYQEELTLADAGFVSAEVKAAMGADGKAMVPLKGL